MRQFDRALVIVMALSGAHCHSPSNNNNNGASDMSAPGGGSGDDLATSGGGGGGGSGGGDLGWSASDLGAIVTPGNPGASDVTFTIHADQMQRRISPLIYGVNNGNQAAAHHATLVRSGGNRLTAFNWETNASNAGRDYGNCENDDYLCGTMGGSNNAYPCMANNDAPGAYLKAVIDQARAAGAAALITVPIVDYVSADKDANTAINCTFSAGRFRMNSAAKGSAFSDPPSTSDNNVYQDEMVNWLKVHEPDATLRFLLDNEPDLWSATHPEVHPSPVTYAELAMRNIQYAKAIKAVMPNVEVWGPVSYGWSGFVSLQNASDAAANGDFLSWWLGQMQAAATGGKPLVDGMDLHWYPEVGDGGPMTGNGYDCRINTDYSQQMPPQADCVSTAGLATMAQQREQAPRSLWDASYVENSYIPSTIEVSGKPGAVNLIPRMQAKIAAKAPGMKLSFSEWSYGGGSEISGAIASADVLGIFGALGVDMATLWETWHDESFTYAAFDAYRNFDGSGGAFGDTSVAAASSDPPTATVYGSLSSASPSRVVIVAINKATTAKTAGITIYHSTTFTTASVHTLTSDGGAKVVAGSALASVGVNAFSYVMPAQSVSVIVPAP